jgi:hypothetical protein
MAKTLARAKRNVRRMEVIRDDDDTSSSEDLESLEHAAGESFSPEDLLLLGYSYQDPR